MLRGRPKGRELEWRIVAAKLTATGLAVVLLTAGCTRASDVHLSDSGPDAQTPATEAAGA